MLKCDVSPAAFAGTKDLILQYQNAFEDFERWMIFWMQVSENVDLRQINAYQTDIGVQESFIVNLAYS